MRTIVDLTDEQLKKLGEICAREHISRAEAIRRAVDAITERDDRAERQAAMRAGFGSWAPREFDGREFIAELRDEWTERERRLGL